MTTARIAGTAFELETEQVEGLMEGADPEPIQEHYVVVGGRRFPPKQVLAVVTGLARADFTTRQARSVLRRLGFGVYRRSVGTATNAAGVGPHGGAEAAMLAPYAGRWVAQDGLEVLFDADAVEPVLRWLRRHGRRARVWQVPDHRSQAGSTQSTP
ncbi:MAG: hypothetical protein ACRD12_20790 [Acidimicrobiales bacterium]